MEPIVSSINTSHCETLSSAVTRTQLTPDPSRDAVRIRKAIKKQAK
jgi:hypothetical protein